MNGNKADSYKKLWINNRRYLGNKYKLLDFIKQVVKDECRGIETVADIFSGTGAVASAFSDRRLITNDLMYSSYICNLAWFGSQKYDPGKMIDFIARYNASSPKRENYMSKNFSGTFFSRSDCMKIGFIRNDIDKSFRAGAINDRERALLITSLLYAMDKIANTCGHYDAYIQGAVYEKELELSVPQASNSNHPGNVCYNTDANKLVKKITADLVYIDPPYNSRQYCDAYHLLENVAGWKKPKVYGVAKKMDRKRLKSDYCTMKAPEAFEQLIKDIKSRYFLFSYNNMAAKGNDRSNATISAGDIMRIHKAKGDVPVFSESYKAFSTGKTNLPEHEERLFLCTCYDNNK